jgi:DNA-binding MarR family transcriptional regulator
MIDERCLAIAISQVLKRMADKGWIASTAIRPGQLSIEYTDHGNERMRTLKGILIQELEAALTSDQFEALIALLQVFDKAPGPPGAGNGTS